MKSNPNIVVIAISEDGRGPAHVKKFMEKNGYTLPVAMDTEGRAQAAYDVKGIPTTVVIGKDGTIAKLHLGELQFDSKEFLAELDTLSKGLPPAGSAPKPGAR